jgi:hypothetical protein
VVIAAFSDHQAETDKFVGAVSGSVSVARVFSPENVARIISAAGSPSTTSEVEVA